MNTKKVFLSLLSAISLCLNCQTSFSTKGKKAKECEDSQVGIGVRFWNDQFKEIFGSNMSSFKNECVKLFPKSDELAACKINNSYIKAFNCKDKNFFILEQYAKDKYQIYVCYSDNAPVSYAIIQKHKSGLLKNVGDIYEIEQMWTDVDFQHMGFGYKLLDFLVEKSQKDKLPLFVIISTDEGTNLYRKILVKTPEGYFKTINSNRLYENVKICKKLGRPNSYGLLKTDKNTKIKYKL